jgi:dTDP-4-dehydrorhamnose reductase
MGVVVLGARGQLARHLRRVMPEAAYWGRDTLDIADLGALEARLTDTRPRAIINAAAYTAVDAAESDRGAAWRLNAEAPAAIARAAEAAGATLVQISTDYVFDGRAERPYSVDAPVNPLSVYGASKLAGELAVRDLCTRHWVLRTSWLFGELGASFVGTVLRLARGSEPLRIVTDQIGRPTYAGDLAALIAALDAAAASPRLPYGIYHATGGPIVSRHAFAERIVERACVLGVLERTIPIEQITSAAFGAAARRPLYSVLEASREIGEVCDVRFDWEAGLDTTLAALRAQGGDDVSK